MHCSFWEDLKRLRTKQSKKQSRESPPPKKTSRYVGDTTTTIELLRILIWAVEDQPPNMRMKNTYEPMLNSHHTLFHLSFIFSWAIPTLERLWKASPGLQTVGRSMPGFPVSKAISCNFCNPRFCIRAGLPQHRIRNPSLEALQWSIWLFKRDLAVDCHGPWCNLMKLKIFCNSEVNSPWVTNMWFGDLFGRTFQISLCIHLTILSAVPPRPPVSLFPSSSMNDHEGSSALLQGHDRHLAIHGMHQDGISNPTTT